MACKEFVYYRIEERVIDPTTVGGAERSFMHGGRHHTNSSQSEGVCLQTTEQLPRNAKPGGL